MAKVSNVSWNNGSWNPWVGCTKCADECLHCYIDREIRKQTDWEKNEYLGLTGQSGVNREPWGKVYLTKTWGDPYKWQAELDHANQVLHDVRLEDMCAGKTWRDFHGNWYAKVFTCSLSDFFIAAADKRSVCPPGYESALSTALKQHRRPAARCESTLWRDCAWQVIKDTPNLIYQILTKRPELVLSRLPKDWGEGYPNVWIGVSVGCNRSLSKVDSLRKIPVHPQAVRFLSCEPLLEDISQGLDLTGIGWVIAGGESGTKPMYDYDPLVRIDLKSNRPVTGHRRMDLKWALRLMRMCCIKDIPFWFKQVSGTSQGLGVDALGQVYHDCPPPPNGGRWVVEVDPKPGDPKGKRRWNTSCSKSEMRAYGANDLDHRELIDSLKHAPYRWILCEYYHPLYIEAFGEPFWTKSTQLCATNFRHDGGKEKRVECLWRNY